MKKSGTEMTPWNFYMKESGAEKTPWNFYMKDTMEFPQTMLLLLGRQKQQRRIMNMALYL